MKQLRIRYQQIGDAGRFFQILSCPDFVYFDANPESVAEERRFLRGSREKRLAGIEHNFTILLGDRIVGAVGIKIDQSRKYIGEIGYFVDRDYWGRGIACEAVALAEDIGFGKLGLRRLELVTLEGNAASIRVAEKCGYVREGVQRGKLVHGGNHVDAVLFAKIR